MPLFINRDGTTAWVTHTISSPLQISITTPRQANSHVLSCVIQYIPMMGQPLLPLPQQPRGPKLPPRCLSPQPRGPKLTPSCLSPQPHRPKLTPHCIPPQPRGPKLPPRCITRASHLSQFTTRHIPQFSNRIYGKHNSRPLYRVTLTFRYRTECRSGPSADIPLHSLSFTIRLIIACKFFQTLR